MNTVEVLMIDDIEDNYNSLKNEAASFNIILRYSQYLEKGIEEIENNRQIAGVILDGKGFIHANQQRGSETIAHVHEGLTRLKLIEQKQDRYIPKFILTAWMDQLKESIGGRAPLYDKNKIGDEVYKANFFKDIRQEIEKTNEHLIKNNYKKVFEIFDKALLPNQYQHELIEMLTEINADNKLEYLSTLRRMRPFIEESFKKLNEIDPNLIPSEYTKKGILNISGIIYYLAGKPRFNKEKQEKEFHADKVIPEHIQSSLNFIWDITSSEAMHPSGQDITGYLVKSSLFALLEYLTWFKNFYFRNYYS